jgi:beta,beta-carotene 9',10'-dioxygenase
MQTVQTTQARPDTADVEKPSLGRPFLWSGPARGECAAQLSGALPVWLRGKLVRTCPAVFERKHFHAQHWFDGLGLIYGFELTESVHFRHCLLSSRVLAEADMPNSHSASFGTEMTRSLFRRLLHPIPGVTDNANVNVIPWQGDWLAMTEAPHQHIIDGATLASKGLYRYDDDLPRGLSMSAHPHYDAVRGALVNVGERLGKKNELVLYHQARTSRTRGVESRITLKRVPYLHSFGLTERHAVVIEHPLSVNPLRMLFSNKGFIDHFEWRPEEGTRLIVIDRRDGTHVAVETESLFCFHTVNTFEDGEDLVFDFLAYDDVQIVSALRMQTLPTSLPTISPRLVRARLGANRKSVELEKLCASRFDLPQIAYAKVSGKRHHVVWGTEFTDTRASTLVKVDLDTGEMRRFSEDGVIYGEPVVVSRPGGEAEDDAVLLTVGTLLDEEKTRLSVLDAKTLERLACADVPLSVPLGFHGSFQSSR